LAILPIRSLTKIKELNVPATVEMYSKWGCGYCVRAKALLDRKGIAYDEYDVTMGGERLTEMRARAPLARTVPQIFIAGRSIGGSDELARLDRSGALDAMIAEAAGPG
jgi:glutaredoxin 3